MGSRKDWDSLFSGLAGGIQAGVKMRNDVSASRNYRALTNKKLAGNAPLKPAPISPDQPNGNSGPPIPETIKPAEIASIPADPNIGAEQRVSGMGALAQAGQQQTAPYSRVQPTQQLPSGGAIVPHGPYKPPGFAEGGQVDIAAGLPVNNPLAEGLTSVVTQEPAQAAIPTEQQQAPQEIAVGVTQQDKDAWDTYRQEYNTWIVDSENSIRSSQGEAGVTQFRQRLMEQSRRKSIGYSTIGTQALAKGNNQVAAAMFNKMALAMPIETGMWFTPNQSGGVTATTEKGSVDYSAENMLALQKMAFSTTDDYVSFLNSQQGYEVDKGNLGLRKDEFADKQQYQNAKIGLDFLGLQLQQQEHKDKMATGGYGAKSDIGDMQKDAESWVANMSRTLGEDTDSGTFNIINFLDEGSQWKKFFAESLRVHKENPTATNVEIFDFIGRQYEADAASGNQQ